MSKKDDLVFATLSSGETVLGRIVRVRGDDFSCDYTSIEPLRYGNEKAANEKVSKVKEQLAAQGKGVGVVKSGDRFLVLVYDVESANELADSFMRRADEESIHELYKQKRFMDHYAENLDLVEVEKRVATSMLTPRKGLKQLAAQYLKPRKLFATVSPDRRCNPRNRHNHGRKGQTDEKYYYIG